jgi:hypothetical protein
LIGGISEGTQASPEAGAENVVATSSVLGITPIDVNDMVLSIPVGYFGVVVLLSVKLDKASDVEVA